MIYVVDKRIKKIIIHKSVRKLSIYIPMWRHWSFTMFNFNKYLNTENKYNMNKWNYYFPSVWLWFVCESIKKKKKKNIEICQTDFIYQLMYVCTDNRTICKTSQNELQNWFSHKFECDISNDATTTTHKYLIMKTAKIGWLANIEEN